jgi:hypothetical protein
LNAVKKVTGKCSQNATVPMSNFKKPMSLCKSDGSWQMLTSECECVAGFIPSKNTNTCARKFSREFIELEFQKFFDKIGFFFDENQQFRRFKN